MYYVKLLLPYTISFNDSNDNSEYKSMTKNEKNVLFCRNMSKF